MTMRSLTGTMILLVSTLLSAGEHPSSGGGIFNEVGTLTVVNTSLSERVIVNYHLEPFPGSGEDQKAPRLDEDVLVTFELRVLDESGKLLAEFTDEVPLGGFGQTTLGATDPTSFDALLAINEAVVTRIPISNDRLAVRIAGSTQRTGRNPSTGETIQIPARRTIFWAVTVVGPNGDTRSTARIRETVPDGFRQTFPVPIL
jgi:hypothetical protein